LKRKVYRREEKGARGVLFGRWRGRKRLVRTKYKGGWDWQGRKENPRKVREVKGQRKRGLTQGSSPSNGIEEKEEARSNRGEPPEVNSYSENIQWSRGKWGEEKKKKKKRLRLALIQILQ